MSVDGTSATTRENRPPHWLACTTAFKEHAGQKLDTAPSNRVFDPRTAAARGDHDLDAQRGVAVIDAVEARPAAVLVPVVARQNGPLTLVLTLRTAKLKSHAGQIAFPGGKVDAGDANPLATALREANEEIGLDRELAEPIGYLDSYQTGSGFRIVPVVALVSPDAHFVPDPDEVDDVFEVPLAFLMDERNHQRHSAIWRGARRYYYAMPYGERYIWGATAGILRNMHERLHQP